MTEEDTTGWTPDDGAGYIPTEERKEYEQQFEQLNEKVIFVEILAELQQIRMALTGAEAVDTGEEQMYRCRLCDGGGTVSAAKREAHARQHNTPPGQAMSIFDAV